ncbi:helix-hairpin-helix domain-containing protein, partial [Streptomyces inhibens]|uniref:helix-hairpin-helix domain-containing protein n=1 Tax=Streptomyces inhibens TaxID=2293571 RepID=UPI0036C84D2B
MSTDRLAGETPPEQEAAPGTADAQTPEDAAAPQEAAAAPGEDAKESDEAAASPAGRAGTPASGAAQETAASGSAKAKAAALAAAVRAVESGERSAASFFTEAPRPARPAAPAAGPGATAPAPGGPAPQGGPAAPAPEVARQRAAHEPQGPGPAGPPAPTAPAPAPAPRPAVTAAPGLDGVRQILAAGGAPETLAEKTAEVLGERAAEALSEDPWQLLGVPGVRPEQADGFARALLGAACGPGDERRAQALVGWLLEQAAVAGHSALEAATLRAALAQRSVPDPDEALQTAIADGAVLVFQDAIEEPGRARPVTGDDEEEAEQPVRILLGLDRFAMAEESVADGLARLLNTFEPLREPEQEQDAEPEQDASADAGEDGDGDGDGTADTEAKADTETEAGDKDVHAGDDAHRADPDATTATTPVRPSPADWEAAAAAAPSASAAELIRAAAHSGLVAHTGAEAARAEPAALIAAARSLGLRAFGATHTENGRRRLAADLSGI